MASMPILRALYAQICHQIPVITKVKIHGAKAYK